MPGSPPPLNGAQLNERLAQVSAELGSLRVSTLICSILT